MGELYGFLDNGTQINIITLGFTENHSLDIRPLSDLIGAWVACISLGNALTQPIGYVIIWVQVDRVQGYDEDQISPGNPGFVLLCGSGPLWSWELPI